MPRKRMIMKKKSSQTNKPAKKSGGKTSLKKQLMRDVLNTPTFRDIETSIQRGTTRTVADFRKFARW
jgi:hypothetical protein